MARYPFQSHFVDGNGKVVGGGTVTVYLTGTTTAATIYTAASGGSAASGGQVTADSTTGYFIFYVDDSNYSPAQAFDIVLSKTNFTSQTYSRVYVVQPYGGPSFSVHRNGTEQSNITGAAKIEWTTEDFDTHSNFDNATNYRFTPTVGAKYLLSASICWKDGSIVANDDLYLDIYKNGSAFKGHVDNALSTIGFTQTVTAVVVADGSSDYFEVFATNGQRDTSDILGASSLTYFTGCRVG